MQFLADDNEWMDKVERKRQRFEFRRLKLQKLIDDEFGGIASDLARKIGKEPSYIHRSLYEEGKEGKKNIGEDMMDAVIYALNLPDNWWTLPLNPSDDVDLSKFTVEKIAHVKKIEAMEESEFRDAVDIFDAAEEIVRRRNKETDN